MRKPYTTRMIIDSESAPYAVRVSGCNDDLVACFWPDPHLGVDHAAACANARLFLLSHEMFDLLEELLPELILAEAGEQAHVDIGRTENMLGRIEAVGPYTRKTSQGQRYPGNYIYLGRFSNEGEYIATFLSGRFVTESEKYKNAKLFTYTPTMVDLLREISVRKIDSTKIAHVVARLG